MQIALINELINKIYTLQIIITWTQIMSNQGETSAKNTCTHGIYSIS